MAVAGEGLGEWGEGGIEVGYAFVGLGEHDCGGGVVGGRQALITFGWLRVDGLIVGIQPTGCLLC